MRKAILITGASRGIGKALAQISGTHYSDLILISRNKYALEQIADALPEVTVHCLGLDLLSSTFGDDLAQALNQINVPIKTLVHNAGLLINKPFEDLALEEVLDMYKVNVLCLYPLLQKAKNYFHEEGAHILCISSMGGVGGSSKFPGLSGYSSSKGAMGILAECLAQEWSETRHRINILALGAVQTEMLAEAFPGYEAPLTADQMAEFIDWFSREGGKYMNGKTIPVAISTP